jgi:hypothetical protein
MGSREPSAGVGLVEASRARQVIGTEATSPKRAGWSASTRRSLMAVAPSAMATARSTSTRPGHGPVGAAWSAPWPLRAVVPTRAHRPVRTTAAPRMGGDTLAAGGHRKVGSGRVTLHLGSALLVWFQLASQSQFALPRWLFRVNTART